METLFETKTTDRLTRALDHLPRAGGILLLTGPHGIGKRGAIELAQQERPNVRRVVLPPGGEKASLRSILCPICEELGLLTGAAESGSNIARRIAQQVRRDDLTLVLDNCEYLRTHQLDTLRYLSDLLPHFALCGTEALLARLSRHGALRCRVRLPIEAAPVTVAELQGIFGGEFSADWLERTHAETGGLWSGIWLLIDQARLYAERTGGSTRDAGAVDAEQVAKLFLLPAA